MKDNNQTSGALNAFRERIKRLSDEELAILSKKMTRERDSNSAELIILAEHIADRYAEQIKSKRRRD